MEDVEERFSYNSGMFEVDSEDTDCGLLGYDTV
jgi:hypothetical protein